MNKSGMLKSCVGIALLTLGAYGQAAEAPLSARAANPAETTVAMPGDVKATTNAVVSSATNVVAASSATNEIKALDTSVPQPVPPATTNVVVIPPPKVEPVEPIPPSELEEGAWLDRIPVGFEEGDEWWRNRVEIGTRITSFSLSDNKRDAGDHYLGSINTLKEGQDNAPYKLFANAWVLKWLGVGLSYETMGVETWTVEAGYDSYSDGTFDVDGPIVSFLVAWPNSTRFTPFAEVGQWLMSGSFNANSAWANAHGIDGYQDFEVVKEEGGLVWGGGCAIQITRHVEMDMLYRQLKGNLVVDHVLLGNVQSSGKEFPLDSSWFGVGIKYRF